MSANKDFANLRLALLQAKYGHPFEAPNSNTADGSFCAVCGHQHVLEAHELRAAPQGETE